MPELPEVETIVRGLKPRVTGRRIGRVRVLRPDLLREDPEAFSARLEARTVVRLERRGKNLAFALSDDGTLLVNLGMTGGMLFSENGEPAEATHPGVRFLFQGGGRLVYDDTRRFGVLEVLDPEQWRDRDRALGPEPLADGYSARKMARALEASRSPVRSWLLDQRKLAGVGNIYANEALHRARIHPARRARTLTSDEVTRLHRAIRAVLRDAIRARGTTFRDYRDADGERGSFAPELRAYGREAEPCARCGDEIRRVVFGNRAAFHCPTCQPEPDEGLP